MKTVTLLRHAKSDWNDSVSRDFDRPLNERGKRAARLMGEWARTQKLRFDAIVASPAVRVTETLDHFLEAYGHSVDTRWDRRIYLASSATLLDVLRDLPDDLGAVLMVGHNPGLEDLVLDTVPDSASDSLREAVEAKYPTATIAALRFEAEHWTDIARPATLTAFTRPRDLDPALGPDIHQH
ncbi:MAG TPA: histidine phosphatase family protein [Sphingobium sp.]|uniref:SixA phosphatase family protein n=1 Tax=Sphingobium sp. TaxID=1912891 RepID=UPI002ED3A0C3